MDEKRPEQSVRIRVTGRVQGVSYRWACEQEATRAGVAGWVRNEADGSVTAYAEGPGEAVDALVAWCHEGPPSARVERVDVEAADAEGVTGFTTLG